MKRYRLYEEKHPQNLSVQLTPDIVSQIEEICECNQDNKEQLLEWIEYIEALKNYISNPVIAFDYANNHKHRPNGCIVINEIGYEAEFSTNIDISNQIFVCIYKINFQLEMYGLTSPEINIDNNNENKTYRKMNRIRLTESQLHNVIRKCINEALDELDWKTYANAYEKQRERDIEANNNNPELNEPTRHLLNMWGNKRARDFYDAAARSFLKQHPGDYELYNIYGVEKGGDMKGTEHLQSYYDKEPRYHKFNPKNPVVIDGPDAIDTYYKGKNPSSKKSFMDASDELKHYHNGDYEYVKGKGWQLKDKGETNESLNRTINRIIREELNRH